MVQSLSDEILNWHEVGTGRWERDLDEAEVFYASLQKLFEGTGRKFFAITGHVSIIVSEELAVTLKEDELDEALRLSWLKLRNTHPSIAAQTIFDGDRGCLKKTYHTADATKHDEWLNQTFRFISTKQNSAEWCNMDPSAPDLATLFAIKSAQSDSTLHRSLVLRSPHDVIDGIGTLQLLGVYLQHLSQRIRLRDWSNRLDWTEESSRLTPPLKVAAGLPNKAPEDIRKALDETQRRSRDLVSQGPPVMMVPHSKQVKLPTAHQRVALQLDTHTTSMVIQACKSASVSITHAYHAAAAVVLASKQENLEVEQHMQYVSYALVNLREQCLPPYNSSDHAAGVYHCTSAEKFGIKFTIPQIGIQPKSIVSEFQRILTEMKEYYVANRPSTEPMLLKIAPMLWRQGTPLIPDEAWTQPYVMPVPLPNSSPSVSMSSFGVIDKMIPPQIGDISVYNPWVTGEELGPGIGLFLGTFRGHLELSAAFNAAWHDLNELQEYLDEMQKTVLAGFGLSSE